MQPAARIYIVRHGETNENRMGVIQGQMDTKLNADGVIQAQLCAERLKGVNFCAAFSSDLQRAARTAEIILANHPEVELIKDAGLRERNMGELQGARAGTYDRTKLPRSVESGEVFTKRTVQWWETSIASHLKAIPEDSDLLNVLVVSHGAYIATLCRALVAHNIVKTPPGNRFGTCLNTSVTIIDMHRNKTGILTTYSDIAHLVCPVVTTNADDQPQG